MNEQRQEVYVVQTTRPIFGAPEVVVIDVDGGLCGLPPRLGLQPGDRLIVERVGTQTEEKHP